MQSNAQHVMRVLYRCTLPTRLTASNRAPHARARTATSPPHGTLVSAMQQLHDGASTEAGSWHKVVDVNGGIGTDSTRICGQLHETINIKQQGGLLIVCWKLVFWLSSVG